MIAECEADEQQSRLQFGTGVRPAGLVRGPKVSFTFANSKCYRYLLQSWEGWERRNFLSACLFPQNWKSKRNFKIFLFKLSMIQALPNSIQFQVSE